MSRAASRYELVSRRRFLGGAVVVGFAGLGGGLACSKSDEEVFSSTAETSGASTSSGGSSSSTTAASGSTTTGAGGPPFPDGGELVIGFSFTPAETGGRINNPYVAVWIENTAGELVETVSLWYKADKDRYLNELRRWYPAEQALRSAGGEDALDTVSGATRVAGAYTVSWDGTDPSGADVTQGDYFVCIEAAREHGPYQLIRESITIGAEAFSADLPDNGELTLASVKLVV